MAALGRVLPDGKQNLVTAKRLTAARLHALRTLDAYYQPEESVGLSRSVPSRTTRLRPWFLAR